MGFITCQQVDHVIKYGTVVPGYEKTVGGSLRLLGELKNRSILKKFEFEDETVFVRYVTNKYALIIDVYKCKGVQKC